MDWQNHRDRRYEPDSSTAGISWPRGFRCQGISCGIKPSEKLDLALILSDAPATCAGVFTQNKFPGAPVTITKSHISSGVARAIICNSGNSNVCNGEQGLTDARDMCQAIADQYALSSEDVLVASTGIIGVPLPMDKVIAGIQKLSVAGVDASREHDRNCAEAILTTDLVPKWESKELTLGTQQIRIAGIAKGSGMIAPNMATMLAFITTDANIESSLLQTALNAAIRDSFNRISVDSDTSTSDMVLVMANGQSEAEEIIEDSAAYQEFCHVLKAVCQSLAYQIIQDGEGMSHVIKVRVSQAQSIEDADLIARTVVDSPLVKTAVHGQDPNWGRLIMAIGRSNAQINPERISIKLGGITIVKDGRGAADLEDKKILLDKAMKQFEIDIEINLGQSGDETGVIWLGCDLSREYIRINADYTT